MRIQTFLLLAALALLTASWQSRAESPSGTRVTVENFNRAESAHYFGRIVARGGFGKLVHNPALAPAESQTVIRPNRDTLYSSGVFDLDAGPLTISLPEAGGRYLSMIAVSEEHFTPGVVYAPGQYRYSREEVGSRYVLIGIRILVEPGNKDDLAAVHALQQQVRVSQPGGPGRYEPESWEATSQARVRKALLALATGLPDSRGMFGANGQVDAVRHLIGSAAAWGGNPEKDALYLTVTPAQNDGATAFRMQVKDVPVDAFWSVSVYNAAGFFEPNAQGAYTLNSLTAKRDRFGAIDIQFGGCDGEVANCLPITPGWNYMVRLYKPRPEILDGRWHFPEAKPSS